MKKVLDRLSIAADTGVAGGEAVSDKSRPQRKRGRRQGREEAMDKQNETTQGAWAARCQCYNGHASASGRCNQRNVTDPHAEPGKAVMCESCRKECCGVKS